MIDSRPAETIFLPRGFSFSSACAGIKPSGRPDLALIECDRPASAAAVFTRNRVVAAPVEVGRAYLKASRGQVRAVLVNSGNANCATGKQGLDGCRAVCSEAANLLRVKSQQLFPSSTGIIGVRFPVEKIVEKLPLLINQRASTDEAARHFASTIMTTDTRPKIASCNFRSHHGNVNLLGFAKGSGMIHPNLATMLVYILTDVAASPSELRRLLRDSCDDTFNCISVDGDTSTNDTVLLLASGQSGASLKQPAVRSKFANALENVCQSLAQQVVSDGEGIQHVIRLDIEQARSRDEALQIARAICHSPLVKTAWAGADPNWGRILSSIGNSGVPIDPARVNIHVGSQKVCHRGQGHPFDPQQAHQHLSQPVCDIRVQLGRGRSSLRFYSTDLTAEYVRINADYST
jgi:glutamate N-acetyltransferase / amino-acid N-acetyltransferase